MASSEIISTSNTWPNYSVGNSANPGKTPGSSVMGKDQFLKILITQLQNQDPMQPMEDKEFIAQMAQFTSVEQLMNISTQLTSLNQSLGSASSLIGKDITWTDSTTLLPKSGTVDSILVSSGVNYAVVGDQKIALSEVTQIKNASTAASVDSSSTTSGGSGESGATT
ncbi:flagellar hook capping FlgD N-terminal domain-containing protein [Paenibacillus sp. BR2-3]|uniref:flagellar hook capping FlgD N-terminal domain-containing protein n=1 Tax=Paenibacillus sp. BR2-3 TaxID=3048494 RepID=UPI00397750A7